MRCRLLQAAVRMLEYHFLRVPRGLAGNLSITGKPYNAFSFAQVFAVVDVRHSRKSVYDSSSCEQALLPEVTQLLQRPERH